MPQTTHFISDTALVVLGVVVPGVVVLGDAGADVVAGALGLVRPWDGAATFLFLHPATTTMVSALMSINTNR